MASQFQTHADASLAALIAAGAKGYTNKQQILTRMISDNAAVNITDLTKANPGNVEAVAHGMLTGDHVYIQNVGGMVEVDGWYAVTKIDADNLTIGVDTTGFTTYTSGGTCQLYHDDPAFWDRFKTAMEALEAAGTWPKGANQGGEYPAFKT